MRSHQSYQTFCVEQCELKGSKKVFMGAIVLHRPKKILKKYLSWFQTDIQKIRCFKGCKEALKDIGVFRFPKKIPIFHGERLTFRKSVESKGSKVVFMDDIILYSSSYFWKGINLGAEQPFFFLSEKSPFMVLNRHTENVVFWGVWGGLIGVFRFPKRYLLFMV